LSCLWLPNMHAALFHQHARRVGLAKTVSIYGATISTMVVLQKIYCFDTVKQYNDTVLANPICVSSPVRAQAAEAEIVSVRAAALEVHQGSSDAPSQALIDEVGVGSRHPLEGAVTPLTGTG